MVFQIARIVGTVALLASIFWSQSDSPKPIKYTLEPVKITNAVYPMQAREQKVQGQVAAMMLVSETGTVENVQVFKADPILSQAVDETIRQWRFKPITKDGSAIPVIAKVTFKFVLPNENQQGVSPEIASATDFPQQARVSDAVMQRLLVSKVGPEYPPAARANHVKGIVTLAVIIGKDGSIKEAQVISGPAELAAAAVDAVRQWRYQPYQLLGRPVEIQTTAQFNFQ